VCATRSPEIPRSGRDGREGQVLSEHIDVTQANITQLAGADAGGQQEQDDGLVPVCRAAFVGLVLTIVPGAGLFARFQHIAYLLTGERLDDWGIGLRAFDGVKDVG